MNERIQNAKSLEDLLNDGKPPYRKEETRLLKGHLAKDGFIFLVIHVKKKNGKLTIHCEVPTGLSEDIKTEKFTQMWAELKSKYNL